MREPEWTRSIGARAALAASLAVALGAYAAGCGGDTSCGLLCDEAGDASIGSDGAAFDVARRVDAPTFPGDSGVRADGGIPDTGVMPGPPDDGSFQDVEIVDAFFPDAGDDAGDDAGEDAGDDSGDDSGASWCSPTCDVGDPCGSNGDCAAERCSSGVCLPPTCAPKCGIGNPCDQDSDCAGMSCGDNYTCTTPDCSPTCDTSDFCSSNADCASETCTSGVCEPPSCEPNCGLGHACDEDSDCASRNCDGNNTCAG